MVSISSIFRFFTFHHHHTRLTSVTPNTHGMSGIRASTGRTPSNIPPSTTVLRHFLLYTHSLYVFLYTTPPRFPRSTSFYHSGHIHPCAFHRPIVLFCSTCPNHLSLALWILFSTHSMPKWLDSSSLCFLSFKDTSHILRTIILSVLLNLARSSAFIAQVSLPYTNTLWTQASYIFPFSFKETPLFVKTGASSLNFPQADRTLVLEASSAPLLHITYRQDSRIYQQVQISIHHPVQHTPPLSWLNPELPWHMSCIWMPPRLLLSVSCRCHYSACVPTSCIRYTIQSWHQHSYHTPHKGTFWNQLLSEDQLHISWLSFSPHSPSTPLPPIHSSTFAASTSNHPPNRPIAPSHLHTTTPKAILCHQTFWTVLP